MKGFIYITTNHITGIKYIGKKYYFYNNGKESNWRCYLGSSKILLADIDRYGIENFSKEILCECETAEALAIKEKEYIELYNAVLSEDFYNLSNGIDKFFTSEDGVKRGLESRKKWSEEKKKRVSKKLKGRLSSMPKDKLIERNRKISTIHKNNPEFKKMRSRVHIEYMGNLSDEEKKQRFDNIKKSVNSYYDNWTPEKREEHVEVRRNGLVRSRGEWSKKAKEIRDSKIVTLKNVESGEIFQLSLTNAFEMLNCDKSTFYSLVNGKYNIRNNDRNTWKKWTILQN